MQSEIYNLSIRRSRNSRRLSLPQSVTDREICRRFPCWRGATDRECVVFLPRREPPKETSPFCRGVVEVSGIRGFATERRERKNEKRERKKK